MIGAFGLSRAKRRPSINITSLIDVMFLLLIFFMVSSTFKEQLGIDITLPQASTSTNQEAGIHEIVVDEGGGYFFGEAPVSLEELRVALPRVLEEDPQAKLVLRADTHADFGSVIAAIDVVKEVGGTQLIIPTTIPEPGLARR